MSSGLEILDRNPNVDSDTINSTYFNPGFTKMQLEFGLTTERRVERLEKITASNINSKIEQYGGNARTRMKAKLAAKRAAVKTN